MTISSVYEAKIESKREDIIDILSELGEMPSNLRNVICELSRKM
jgi:hypothetical protein